MFYIMGGNKVAPPKKAGQAGAAPSGTGRTYTGAKAAGSGIGAGAGPKKFGSSMNAGGSAEIEKYEQKI